MYYIFGVLIKNRAGQRLDKGIYPKKSRNAFDLDLEVLFFKATQLFNLVFLYFNSYIFL